MVFTGGVFAYATSHTVVDPTLQIPEITKISRGPAHVAHILSLFFDMDMQVTDATGFTFFKDGVSTIVNDVQKSAGGDRKIWVTSNSKFNQSPKLKIIYDSSIGNLESTYGVSPNSFILTKEANRNPANGNHWSISNDITIPILSVFPNIVAEAIDIDTLVTIENATATDIVDSSPIVTNNATKLITDGFPFGITTILWTATDSSGNYANATQTITIEDTTAPTLNIPSNSTITLYKNQIPANLTESDYGNATATDIFLPVTITNNATNYLFPLGDTIIKWIATDTNGNESTDTQRITLQAIKTKSGGCSDCEAPTMGVNKNNIQLIDGGFKLDDYTVDVEWFDQEIQRQTFDTNKSIMATLHFYEDTIAENIQHVEFAFDEDRKTVIEWDKDSDLIINDPTSILANVSVTSKIINNNEAEFYFTFEITQPTDIDTLYVYFWDTKRNSGNNYFYNAMSIVGEPKTETKTDKQTSKVKTDTPTENKKVEPGCGDGKDIANDKCPPIKTDEPTCGKGTELVNGKCHAIVIPTVITSNDAEKQNSCKDGYLEMIKISNDKPVCVKEESASKLEQRQWAKYS